MYHWEGCNMSGSILYTVIRIDGDYAVLRCEGSEDTAVALMLLPEDIDEGMQLKYENMEYSIMK